MKQYLDQQGVEYLWGKIKRNFANLSNNGKVPASQLPSYVDDVEEYENILSFPNQGEEGKIYVAKDTNLTYRWGGSTYVEISQSIALGETSVTAYPGDKGKQLADDLMAEVDRANHEEADIRAALTAEKNRAEASERDNRSLIEKNTNDIVKEINNRVAGDESLSASINAETLARQDADDEEKLARQEADATEKAERQSEDNLIRAKIEQEQTRAEDAERLISNTLSNEIDRAKAAEQALQAKVSSVTIAKVNPHDSTTAVSYQLQINGEANGVTIDIAKDQSIKDIDVLDMNATLNDDGTIQAGSPVGSTALCISYILSNGTYKLAKLDYSKFLEETEFSNGLQVNNHKIYVKVDQLSESFLSISSAGLKITGVQNAINTAVDAERVAREAECKQIKDSITQSGQGSTVALNAEIKRAKEAEAAITSNFNNHISDYHNPHKVTKAQVGLSDVDNTSDADKPVSNATQTELDKKANQTEVNQLQQTITNLQTTIQQLQSQITNMSTTIESVQNNITNMQTTINTLPTVDSNDAKYLRKDKNDVTPYTITAKALYKA